MQTQCAKCQEINDFEKSLNQRAEKLVYDVKRICFGGITKRNNERWRKFAWWCQLPLIGNLIFKLLKVPHGLEPIPEYYERVWYRQERSLIEKEARTLEQLKANHLEHWGDEIVSSADSTDPGGYYTPDKTFRRKCYARSLTPFVPEKYDFSSGMSVNKFWADELVLCSRSKQLVSKVKCDMEVGEKTKWRPVYWLRCFTPPDPTIPGFNEWRTDPLSQYVHSH